MTFPRRGALLLALLLAFVPTACGSDDEDGAGSAYCAAVKKDQDIFADDGTGLGLVTNLSKLKTLAGDAPDDLSDEWQTFLTALESLDKAVTSVGLKPTDFVDGQPPSSLSATDKATITAAANRIAQEDVVDAATGIEQQAKDVCKLQLGL